MLSFRNLGKLKNIIWEVLKHLVCFKEKKTKVDRSWSKITDEEEWNVAIYSQENFGCKIPPLPVLLIATGMQKLTV